MEECDVVISHYGLDDRSLPDLDEGASDYLLKPTPTPWAGYIAILPTICNPYYSNTYAALKVDRASS